MADRMLPPGQLRGQGPCTLANPAQRGLRIAARFRLDQAVQRDWQERIKGEDFLAGAAAVPSSISRTPLAMALRERPQARLACETPP